jgi:CheY-like chemotaxis protein
VSGNGSANHPRGSVLVVDDEPTIAEVVARYLDRAGYEACVAGDGPRALELAGPTSSCSI